MHHSRDETDRMQELVKKLELGPTGHYPDGALNETDEGEIKIAIGIEDGKVVINFGKPVAWIGFDPRQARQIAELLRQKSHQIERNDPTP